MQLREIIERYRGEHVMLDVIVHVPIEKTYDGPAFHRVAGHAPVGCALGEARVLHRRAECPEEVCEEDTESDEVNQDPQMGAYEEDCKEKVTRQQRSREAHHRSSP